MVVPFIFENEVYTKSKEPYLWVFYKFADLCIKNNLPIIAEESYFQKPSYFKKQKHPAVNVMEFYNINDQRLKKLKGFKITTKEKQQIINNYKDNSTCWVNLIKGRDKTLEEIVEKKIQKIEKQYGKIDAFIVWTWLPSIEYVAIKHNIKIINMEGSSIRQPFYNELLTYFQFQNKYDCTGINERYQELVEEKDILYLSRKELFSIFAEKDNLKYLKKFDQIPNYKIGYALGIKTDCFAKVYSNIDQKKVLKELSKNIDPKKISVRPHPLEPIDVNKLGGYTEDKSKSIFEWILNCESIVCDLSNIGLDALLVGRNLISLSDKMPSSFHKITDLNKITKSYMDERKLNFLLFYWYVPETLTQDYQYIKWRMTNPTVKDIYNKHLEYILKERNMSISKLKQISKNRIEYILQKMNLTEEEIKGLIKKDIGEEKMEDINSYQNDSYEYRKEILNLRKDLETKSKKIIELEHEKSFFQNELNKVLNSKSWEITKPLRKIMSINQKTKLKKDSIEKEEQPYENDYHKYPIYTSEYQENMDFSNYKTDIKVLTFYLPQYHTFKENDEWWGKGFTEWTNTKKSLPRFEGHYQPRTPHKDIGYYQLDNIETIKKQIELAKQHGIYGFCFYYYWFSGKRLMEKPVDLFLKNKDVDYPFCLCWANENWTKAWDGRTDSILIKQEYSKQDYRQFIKDIKKYITDKRYIKIDNKPVILIYNPTEIPNFKELVENWRKYAREENIGELYIISKCDLANTEYKYTEYVDAEFDFPPQGIGHKETKITGLSSPKIFNYKKIVDDIERLYREHYPLKTFFYTATMGWDNSPRRKENYTVYYNYSLESYYKWLRILIQETKRRNPEDRRFIFINAWNEWAEGTYLEPDEKYGYANINTLSKAIFDLPLEEKKKNSKKQR